MFVRQNGRVKDRFGNALTFLFEVAAKGYFGIFVQAADGVEVGEAQESHEEVGQVPDQGKFGHAAKDYHADNQRAEEEQTALAFGFKERDIDFAVVVVAYDGAEGEHENHEGNSSRSGSAEDAGQRGLRQCDTRQFAANRVLACQQYDKGCSRTYQPGIYINAEGLNKTLLNRMADICSSGSIRHGTFTSFVGEQAAFHTRENGRTKTTAYSSLRGERIMENQGEHGRNFVDIHDGDDDGYENVKTGHNGHEEFRNLRNALYAAADDQAGEEGQYASRYILGNIEGSSSGQGNGVGLHGVIDKTKGHGQEYGKELGYTGLMQGVFDIVCRATMEGTIGTLNLVNLCQGALHKTRGTADKGDNPHPEYRAGAAGDNGNGHAGDIAHTHAGSRADTECLKGADGTALGFCPNPFGQKPQHFRQHPQLDKFRRQGEVDAAAYENDDEHIRPE